MANRLKVVMPFSFLQTEDNLFVLSAERERKETGSFITLQINMEEKKREKKEKNTSFHYCYCILVPLHT